MTGLTSLYLRWFVTKIQYYISNFVSDNYNWNDLSLSYVYLSYTLLIIFEVMWPKYNIIFAIVFQTIIIGTILIQKWILKVQVNITYNTSTKEIFRYLKDVNNCQNDTKLSRRRKWGRLPSQYSKFEWSLLPIYFCLMTVRRFLNS